jgi:hypothetical protein
MAKVLTQDEALRIASNIARAPNLNPRDSSKTPSKPANELEGLDRQLYCIACTVAPIVARQAALKMPTAIVDHDERLLALVAASL